MTDSEDYFVFADDEDFEPTSAYTPGGLCPIRLGCTLGSPPRYRVLAKLGHGSFSTVWMAHDRVRHQNVALKIVEARRTSKSQEMEILQRLKAPRANVVQLLDVFEHTSPNGIHQVLVMELLRPLHYTRWEFRPIFVRTVLRQVIEGLEFIHSRGVAHGDLHPGNVGAAMPEIVPLSVKEVWNCAGRPLTQLAVIHPSGDLNMNSYPPYLCETIDMEAFILRQVAVTGVAQRPLSIRILDLGNAYILNESSSPKCITPMGYWSPEVAFAQIALGDENAPWDQRSDIWSLAVCIYGLICSGDLFPFVKDRLLHEMMMYCGEVPDAWRPYVRSNPFPQVPTGDVPSIVHADKLWKAKEAVLEWYGVENAPGLVRLLRRMLNLDPSKRPTAAELLRDPSAGADGSTGANDPGNVDSETFGGSMTKGA
ncbi:kinase-like domain-containing protein [Mycena pura]|uniref:non-specific serine/threonine protein kinase n=1 Tax=Mycena pura TaxID=153505 RepID=A0AAD6V1J3_9AGAR|nr:kinase-like domain-containing protein [Mycena pura]